MAYTPINWQTGDTITAEKLNRCDNGWSVESTPLFSETVTTVNQDGYNDGTISYSGSIVADTILVSFDGTDYVCDRLEDYSYGAQYSEATGSIDFSVYPFQIWPNEGSYGLTTESAGTYALSVGISQVETSSDFALAVNSVVDEPSSVPMECVPTATTYQEMRTARDAGRLMYAYLSRRNCVLINSVPNDQSGSVGYYPQTAGLTLTFDNDGILQAIQ